MKDDNLPTWVNSYGWTNIIDKWPTPNSEVVVFYVANSEEGTCSYNAEVIHEKFIDAIHTSILYWINKPE